MNDRFWNNSQDAERDFWTQNPSQHGHFSEDYWDRELGLFPGGWGVERFEGKDILEIGCGPKGMIHYIPGRRKVGVDPLIATYIDLGILERDGADHITGTGEQLGLPDDSFDIVVCFNVLDHCQDPNGVCREIHRVLRPAGRLLMHCHCIEPVLLPFRPFLRHVDKPHPWHFTAHEIREMLRRANLVEEHGQTSVFHWRARSWVKHLLARTFIRNFCSVCTK